MPDFQLHHKLLVVVIDYEIHSAVVTGLRLNVVVASPVAFSQKDKYSSGWSLYSRQVCVSLQNTVVKDCSSSNALSPMPSKLVLRITYRSEMRLQIRFRVVVFVDHG